MSNGCCDPGGPGPDGLRAQVVSTALALAFVLVGWAAYHLVGAGPAVALYLAA